MHQKLLQIGECIDSLKKVIELDGQNEEYGKRARKDIEEITLMTEKVTGLTLDQYLKNKTCFERAFEDLKSGRLDQAMEGFQHVLKVEPRHVQSYGNLGLVFATIGDRESALKSFDRALELDPQYHLARENRLVAEKLKPGEKVDLSRMGETEFYAEKVKAKSRLGFLKKFLGASETTHDNP